MADKIKKPLIREGLNSSSIPELIDKESKNPDVSLLYIVFHPNPKFEVCRFAKSPSWILTPFWINIFGPSEVPKCLVQQVQNGFICWIRLRNGCVRAKRKKQWLMAPSSFNPPLLSFEKKILLRYFFIERSNPKFQLIHIQID
jgi:hypothetical protein